MDGGTEWDVVQSWLEMADREDLLALLAYLGVDMGSLTPEELVKPGCLLVGVVSVDFTGRGSLRNEITS